jgi:hypothetical protein
MTKVVIDTNVLLVANGKHEDVSEECVAECAKRLEAISKTGVVYLDDGYRILSEYKNKTSPNQPKGPGDVFLKWLLRNTANSQRVIQVAITESPKNHFAEFPGTDLQASFDPPDRKFVAVANAHTDKPRLWQAADCKWLKAWPKLREAGVEVDFLCPDDICRFYKEKFPEDPTPELCLNR